MAIRIQENCQGIDWEEVHRLLDSVHMASHPLTEMRRAFENSYRVVFAFEDDSLLGIGRAVSDGAYEAAIYDVAIRPDRQGQGLGALIVKTLLEGLPGMNVILFAMPGREGFYRKIGFARMLTGMASFVRRDAMRQKGFTD